MKTDLHHLPKQKAAEIRAITEAIVAALQPLMVILFGSYSRGDWVKDR